MEAKIGKELKVNKWPAWLTVPTIEETHNIGASGFNPAGSKTKQ